MPYTNNIELSRQWQAARRQIQAALDELDLCCVATGMSTVESEANYLSVGFGGIVPTRCDFLFVLLTDNNLFMSVDDGVTWFKIFDPAAVGVPLLGTSLVTEYGGDETDVPTGWLLCDGQAVSRTTYADLFAEIGTTFGIGDGATTFNVPDLRGRSPRGANIAAYPNGDDGAFATSAVADTGGAETHQLIISEMPSHLHSATRPNASQGVRATTGNLTYNFTALSNGGSTGGDVAHENMPPAVVVNYIIKT